MATKAQIQAFIDKLSALAVAEARERAKWVLPSVCIAQAALETGWGTAAIMTKANAYFGIKATTSWPGKVYSARTKECYDGITYTEITDCFRAYDSVEESVADYFDLITGLSRYAGAVNNADAQATITAIKEGGYATAPTYVEAVMGIIETYGLTRYDNFAQTDTETNKEVFTMEISMIRKGMRGDNVKAVQQLLIANGYTCGKAGADGIYGDATENAILLYQEDHGLVPDAIVGALTLGSLLGY